MPRIAKLPDYFKTIDFRQEFRAHGMKKGGIRILAFKLIQEGKTIKEVSSLISIPHFTIRKWMDVFEERGVGGLIDQEGRNLRTNNERKKPQSLQKVFVTGHQEKSAWKIYNTKPESEGVFNILSKIKKVWKREKQKQ